MIAVYSGGRLDQRPVACREIQTRILPSVCYVIHIPGIPGRDEVSQNHEFGIYCRVKRGQRISSNELSRRLIHFSMQEYECVRWSSWRCS